MKKSSRTVRDDCHGCGYEHYEGVVTADEVNQITTACDTYYRFAETKLTPPCLPLLEKSAGRVATMVDGQRDQQDPAPGIQRDSSAYTHWRWSK